MTVVPLIRKQSSSGNRLISSRTAVLHLQNGTVPFRKSLSISNGPECAENHLSGTGRFAGFIGFPVGNFSGTEFLIFRSGNKIRHTYLDGASARTTTIRTSEGKFHISSKTEKLKLECTIALDPSGVTWTCECEILQNPPEGTTMQLIFPVVLKNGHFVSVNRVNPLQIEWNGGQSGALEFPRDFQWHNGYYGDRQNISFTPFPRGKCVQGMKKIFSFHLTLP